MDEEQEIKELIEKLGDGSTNFLHNPGAIEALIKIGEPAIPYLIEEMNNNWDKVLMENSAIVVAYHYVKKKEWTKLEEMLGDKDALINCVIERGWMRKEYTGPASEKLMYIRVGLMEGVEKAAKNRMDITPFIPWLIIVLGDIAASTEAAEEAINTHLENSGDYHSVLEAIKNNTQIIMEKYKGKKNRDSFKERKEALRFCVWLTHKVQDKMNPDKKKFHKPVKHQPVRAVKRKVRTNG